MGNQIRVDKKAILDQIDFKSFYSTQIPSLKINGRTQATGICPFHNDHDPSLSVNIDEGLWNCRAGCGGGDVFKFYMKCKDVDFKTAVQEIAEGQGMAEARVKQKLVATFKYRDDGDSLLYIKQRLEPGQNGRKKSFLFKHPKGNSLVSGRGCEPVLYNLPQINQSKYVFFVEGEAKADGLNKWDLPATCLDSGAQSKWKESYTPIIEGKEKVVILPDNDNPGKGYASKIANALHGWVEEIKVVELPGLPEKGDILDWIEVEGNDKEKLLELIKETSEWTPEEPVEAIEETDEELKSQKKVHAVSITEILSMEFQPRGNVLNPWLPTQGLAMLHAPRGIGKTFVGIGCAVAVASGDKFLKWQAEKPRGVLYVDGEMPAVVLQERLSIAITGGDKEPSALLKIITPDLQPSGRGMPNLTDLKGQEEIEPHLEDISLIVIDNISTLCRGGRENESESWLPVQEWALQLRSRGISVLFIHHSGKGGWQRGTSRREDVLDTVINLKHPGDYRPEEGARFEVHFEKHRGIYGDDVKPFEAKLVNKEWVIQNLEDSLTDRVASLFNEGIPQSEMPELLGIAKGTVSKHKTKAMEMGLLR